MAHFLKGGDFYALACTTETLLYNKKSKDVSFIKYPELPLPVPPAPKDEEAETSDKITEEAQNSDIITEDDSLIIDEPEPEGGESLKKKPTAKTKSTKNSVLCGAMSNCGKYLALADEEKRLLILKHDSSWQLLSNRSVIRKCFKLKFTHSTKYLLAADRGGDVYQFSVHENDSKSTLILGHLSMLLDLIITPDDKYVITCDRDEKIRVSHFPNCYNIHTYCLGHTEFVTSLSFCGEKSEYLLSGSGDCTLRIWNYLEGKQLDICNYSKDILPKNDEERSPALKQLSCSGNLVATILDGSNLCGIFQSLNEEGKPALKYLRNIDLHTEPMSVSFLSSKIVFLTTDESNPLKVYNSTDNINFEITPESFDMPISLFSKEVKAKWDQYKDFVDVKLDTQILYKQWFDNVEIYQEKKKQRLETKKSKIKS